MTTEDHRPTAHAGPQTGGLGRRMRSTMTSRNHAWRWAAVTLAAPVLVFAALPAAARTARCLGANHPPGSPRDPAQVLQSRRLRRRGNLPRHPGQRHRHHPGRDLRGHAHLGQRQRLGQPGHRGLAAPRRPDHRPRLPLQNPVPDRARDHRRVGAICALGPGAGWVTERDRGVIRACRPIAAHCSGYLCELSRSPPTRSVQATSRSPLPNAEDLAIGVGTWSMSRRGSLSRCPPRPGSPLARRSLHPPSAVGHARPHRPSRHAVVPRRCRPG